MSNNAHTQEISAGGVAYRTIAGRVEIALIQVAGRWHLPKGGPISGETMEETALREVKEETHIEADLIRHIDTIEYTYSTSGMEPQQVHKAVHFYLMRYVDGDILPQLSEVDHATWIGIDDALDLLTFENERRVIEQAREMIQNDR
jgi:diadenosine hexaphosphate hydrolase (ATP-forming)